MIDALRKSKLEFTRNYDRFKSRDDTLDLSPKKLGCAAQGIPALSVCSLILLNRHIFLVPGRQFASLQEVPDIPRSLDLTVLHSRLYVNSSAQRSAMAHDQGVGARPCE